MVKSQCHEFISEFTMSCLRSCEDPGLFSSSVVLASKPFGKRELSGGAFTMIALNLGMRYQH